MTPYLKYYNEKEFETTSDSILCRMVEQLQAFGMEEVVKKIMLRLAGNGMYAGHGDKISLYDLRKKPDEVKISKDMFK